MNISPKVWPGAELIAIQPGDLSQFAPYGNGVYGYQSNPRYNPFLDGPSQEPCAGTVYFDNSVKKEDFEGLLRLLEVSKNYRKKTNDFAIFKENSEAPQKEKYLSQIRIVSKFALKYLFNVLNEDGYNSFPEQNLTIEETLWEFIESEKKEWGVTFWEDKLDGLFGGDGDYAREKLSFGFSIENHYHGVYRIWSRAWLVTK